MYTAMSSLDISFKLCDLNLPYMPLLSDSTRWQPSVGCCSQTPSPTPERSASRLGKCPSPKVKLRLSRDLLSTTESPHADAPFPGSTPSQETPQPHSVAPAHGLKVTLRLKPAEVRSDSGAPPRGSSLSGFGCTAHLPTLQVMNEHVSTWCACTRPPAHLSAV